MEKISLNDQIVIKGTKTVNLSGTAVRVDTKTWDIALTFPFTTKDANYNASFGTIYMLGVGNLASGTPSASYKETTGMGVRITDANGAENYHNCVLRIPVTISW